MTLSLLIATFVHGLAAAAAVDLNAWDKTKPFDWKVAGFRWVLGGAVSVLVFLAAPGNL